MPPIECQFYIPYVSRLPGYSTGDMSTLCEDEMGVPIAKLQQQSQAQKLTEPEAYFMRGPSIWCSHWCTMGSEELPARLLSSLSSAALNCWYLYISRTGLRRKPHWGGGKSAACS